jgi:hypothetical protein
MTLALAAVLAVGTAHAAPQTVGYAGRLLQNGQPVDGSITAIFDLYDQASGGAKLWSEVHTGVTVVAGSFSLALGSKTPFGAAVFDGTVRWLEVTIGNETLLPRVAIHSVPYCLLANTAANATGNITPKSVSVGGKQVIDSTGKWVGDLAVYGCSCGTCWESRDRQVQTGCNSCYVRELCTPGGWRQTGNRWCNDNCP